jgi:MoxR-like ATPase
MAVIVGRDHEITLVRRHLDGGFAALVEGAPGIVKTALVAAATADQLRRLLGQRWRPAFRR